MNTIQIKNGSTVPLNSQLANFELGYVRGGELYINNGGTIVQLTSSAAAGLISDGSLKLPALNTVDEAQDYILVADDQGKVYSRTPSQICSDIGALSLSGGTITGKTTLNGAIVVGANNYGYTDPNTDGKTGVPGQLYFVITG